MFETLHCIKYIIEDIGCSRDNILKEKCTESKIYKTKFKNLKYIFKEFFSSFSYRKNVNSNEFSVIIYMNINVSYENVQTPRLLTYEFYFFSPFYLNNIIHLSYIPTSVPFPFFSCPSPFPSIQSLSTPPPSPFRKG